MNTRTKLIGTIVVGAALFVPVAQAERPDDRAGARGPGGIAQEIGSTHPDNRSTARGPGAFATQAAAATRPDDRGGIRGPGAYRSPDLAPTSHPDDRPDPRGPGALATTVQPASSGFAWREALLGGLGGMGLALVLTGCLFLFVSQRNKTRIA